MYSLPISAHAVSTCEVSGCGLDGGGACGVAIAEWQVARGRGRAAFASLGATAASSLPAGRRAPSRAAIARSPSQPVCYHAPPARGCTSSARPLSKAGPSRGPMESAMVVSVLGEPSLAPSAPRTQRILVPMLVDPMQGARQRRSPQWSPRSMATSLRRSAPRPPTARTSGASSWAGLGRTAGAACAQGAPPQQAPATPARAPILRHTRGEPPPPPSPPQLGSAHLVGGAAGAQPAPPRPAPPVPLQRRGGRAVQGWGGAPRLAGPFARSAPNGGHPPLPRSLRSSAAPAPTAAPAAPPPPRRSPAAAAAAGAAEAAAAGQAGAAGGRARQRQRRRRRRWRQRPRRQGPAGRPPRRASPAGAGRAGEPHRAWQPCLLQRRRAAAAPWR
jgi:hypothetical protein